MTAKQKAARAKFKQVVAEAKKLRKKNPKLTQAQAVKQAWAIEYKKAPKKVAEVGKIKKTAPKKKAAAKKASPKKKAAAKKSTSYHNDTKSHNVNIRVVSGIDHSFNIERLNKTMKRKEVLETTLQKLKSIPIKERSAGEKMLIKKIPVLIRGEKSLISQLKKMIK